MNGLTDLIKSVAAAPVVLAGLWPFLWMSEASAADLGVRGELFEVTEPDLLAAIYEELRKAEKDGRIEAMNKQMAETAKKPFYDPGPVTGIREATEYKTRLFNPAVTLDRDIRAPDGRLIAKKGTTANPLDVHGLEGDLLFIDGRSGGQMAWALAKPDTDRIILVAGAPLPLMEKHNRRLYYDQQGWLVGRFGIEHVPARISQEGKVLRIEEMPVENGEVREKQ